MKAQITLIRGAEVYAPEPLGVQDILLGGGSILDIAPRLSPNLLILIEIDAAGMLALPGLVDGHIHITGGGGERGFSSRVAELTAEDLLACGVTTVVGVLGTDSGSRSVASLVAKAKSLREQGITAYCLTGAYDLPSPTLTGSVKDDVAYIDEVLGVKVALSDHRCAQPTQEELTRLAAHVRLAALTAGKAGVVHIHTGCGKRGLGMIFDILRDSDLPPLQFRPTHVENALSDAVEFAKLGGMIDFTADADAEAIAQKILSAEAAGAPWEQITMSSDAGGSIPVWNESREMTGMDVGHSDTLLLVVRALTDSRAIPLEKALRLVTVTPADALLLPQKGRLTPGADADILLTDKALTPCKVFTAGRLRWAR
ncbi:MAG: beta-aspartyl-peptidase [Oscillospiraceae bacterium]|nr:beta-aspartyl-peptidase [Oscillospiraceae bacterium]